MSTNSTPINLRVAIKNLDSLPTLPLIAQKLLSLETDSDEGQKQLLLLIEQDPQIMGKIIGLANAPIYGSSRKITSISEAAIVLGINRIKSVSTGIAVMSLKSAAATGSLNMQDLWMHNLGISYAMLSIGRAMPRKIRPADDYIFLSGMLHDIGYIALSHLDPQRSNELHTYLAEKNSRSIVEIEKALLDISHDELGAELAKHWNLPADVVAVIRYHHTPDAPNAPKDNLLIRMVYIAEKMLPSFGMGEHVDPGIHDSDWHALSINPSNAEEILCQAAEQADQATLFAANLC